MDAISRSCVGRRRRTNEGWSAAFGPSGADARRAVMTESGHMWCHMVGLAKTFFVLGSLGAPQSWVEELLHTSGVSAIICKNAAGSTLKEPSALWFHHWVSQFCAAGRPKQTASLQVPGSLLLLCVALLFVLCAARSKVFPVVLLANLQTALLPFVSLLLFFF